MQKFQELDEMMSQGINKLKNDIKHMNYESHMLTGAKSLRDLDPRNRGEARDMPIKVLDSLINNEELGNNGFSVYNRGQQLKTSLIDPARVKAFIDQ